MNEFYNPDAAEQLSDLFVDRPAEAVAHIAMASAQQVYDANLGQMLHAAWEAGAAQNEPLRQAQAESALLDADRALSAKYGVDDWKAIREEIGVYVEKNPDVLSDPILLSPQALANRLDDLAKVVRGDALQKRDNQTFDRIKKAGVMTYQDLMSGSSRAED